MLTQVAEGVLIHDSDFIETKSIVVQGRDGVLLIDPGISVVELADLANDLRLLGRPVVAGFATHPDWDHALWHPEFGDAPRYGTARCAASLQELLSKPDWREIMGPVMPDDAGEIPLDLFGRITGLPPGADRIPWNGPTIRIIEHQGHAQGHAALVIEDSRILVAGDMLSDILMPFLELDSADPIGDYLAGLDLLEGAVADVDVVIPGHGSVGRCEQMRERLTLDRAYVEALRDGRVPDDPRVGPQATFGTDWLPGVHEWQAQRLLERS